MKLYSITIFATEPNQPAINLAGEYDLSEFMTFFAKTVAERTKPGQRQSVEENNYVFYAFSRPEGLTGIIICDNERSHNKELNDKTNNFFQNSSGQMSINIIENLGNLEIESNEKDNSNKIFNEEDKAGDNIDLDYVSKLNYSQVNQLVAQNMQIIQ
ncbi:19423_t:CDS:2 [Entrophospora sp. SA101]|nr:19423_t:CDS:2 [Entrophospora sp. SA101]